MVDVHYEVPSPYRDGNLQLPNNKEQAIRRIQQLKKRFQKDLEFFNSYTKQIEELILKGYAKQSSSNSIKGKTWYLPHHGIKHASKPGKVRIVFDCSTNYGGTSLNKKLLSGPDLTSQLAGVLTRLRTEEVTFIGDIEAMYYQVQVRKEQRSVLRFLWWEDSDLGGDLLDHEKCIHVFGGTSSPGCCNYALRKTGFTISMWMISLSHWKPKNQQSD